MASTQTTSLNQKTNPSEIRKLTAVALALMLGMTTITQWGYPQAVASTGTGLTATYYDNQNFTGQSITRIDEQVNFDWDYNSPDPSMHNETYSARWEGSVVPRHSDTYNFYTYSDDGVRLWVDGRLIIDNWTDHPRTENIGYIHLNAGQKYPIKLEYYENTGRAIMQLSWSSNRQHKEIIPRNQLYPISQTGTGLPTDNANGSGFSAEYFDRIDFNGLKVTKTEPVINFDWKAGTPDSNIPRDNFSARWTGNIKPAQSTHYTFHSLSDDGVRVWVNNQLIIDNWSDHPATENTGHIYLEAGKSYPVKMEYYERWGEATASLHWSSPAMSKTLVRPESNSQQNQPTPAPQQPQPAPTPPVNEPVVNLTGNPLGNADFYVNPHSQAQNWVNNNRGHWQAQAIEKLAQQPIAQWLGGWNGNVYEDVRKAVNSANGKTVVFVAYNIPQRDCGSYSAGGVGSPEAYKSWIGAIGAGIGNAKALVVLEPDALSLMDCLSGHDKEVRMNTLRDAVHILRKNPNTAVYIDAGHSGWVNPDEMASRLRKAGVDSANGFALNTSNFVSTQDNINYGQQVSGKVGGKKFVIDTSRNGRGPAPDYQWCNPQGRALGQTPTTNTGNGSVDAYLWIKAPGESDGSCNGGPSAGTFWPEYAYNLAKNAGW